MVASILDLLGSKGLLERRLTFFDAFCGMGAVSHSLKNHFNLVANDILHCCTVYTKARVLAERMNISTSALQLIGELNSTASFDHGFFFNTYSPGGSERMYFTEENAGRIDFFRRTIEEWYANGRIDADLYTYLLGCLLESVSLVSNTAGVYGAYLKTWDPRALKPILIKPLATEGLFVQQTPLNITVYNSKVEDVVAHVDCDVLYLDPPYTQNQYGTQYHLLETLIRNDRPSVSPITGFRPVAPLRSDWSRLYKCHILLDKVLAETKACRIVLSYNNDGFMSKDFIEALLKRYGREDTYECNVIDYKKYNNKKCQGSCGHVEYLFYVEKKKACDIVFESPLNYTGSKSKMVSVIRDNLPKGVQTFADAFAGGFNVGVNMEKEVIYNDINVFVEGLIHSFHEIDTYEYLCKINRFIKKYGLAPSNSEAYRKLRADYNAVPAKDRDPIMLYTIILYGFQQQIRFNGRHEFNNPAGSRYFNARLMEKFISFSRAIKRKQITFRVGSYEELGSLADHDIFFYFDPPYYNTLGVYNDGKRGFGGWDKQQEQKLCSVIDRLHDRGGRFMLSYLVEIGDDSNREILKWQEERGYRLINIPQPQGRYGRRREVLIINY